MSAAAETIQKAFRRRRAVPLSSRLVGFVGFVAATFFVADDSASDNPTSADHNAIVSCYGADLDSLEADELMRRGRWRSLAVVAVFAAVAVCGDLARRRR